MRCAVPNNERSAALAHAQSPATCSAMRISSLITFWYLQLKRDSGSEWAALQVAESLKLAGPGTAGSQCNLASTPSWSPAEFARQVQKASLDPHAALRRGLGPTCQISRVLSTALATTHFHAASASSASSSSTSSARTAWTSRLVRASQLLVARQASSIWQCLTGCSFHRHEANTHWSPRVRCCKMEATCVRCTAC